MSSALATPYLYRDYLHCYLDPIESLRISLRRWIFSLQRVLQVEGIWEIAQRKDLNLSHLGREDMMQPDRPVDLVKGYFQAACRSLAAHIARSF